MNPWTIGGTVALVLALIGGGYYFGTLHGKAAVEAQGEAQLKAVVVALDEQATQRQAVEAQLQKVTNAYDELKSTPDPVAAGLAQRMYLVTAPGHCPVPGAAPVPAGAEAPSPEPSRDASIVGLTQAVFDACSADAKQLNALIQLAP